MEDFSQREIERVIIPGPEEPRESRERRLRRKLENGEFSPQEELRARVLLGPSLEEEPPQTEARDVRITLNLRATADPTEQQKNRASVRRTRLAMESVIDSGRPYSRLDLDGLHSDVSMAPFVAATARLAVADENPKIHVRL